MKKDPMLDQDFLRALDHWKHHDIWVKIISLNFDEYPMEEITGRVSSGSINVDGTSSVRRTCSISMVSETVKITDLFWGLRTKFALYIGLENHIDPEYDDIIWFKQGVFFITSFNTTAGTNNFNISIQGKDKMSLLNGDMGGIIPASWDFATEDVTETDEEGDSYVVNNRIPIKNIILEAVHEFAQEPWQNIVVNDLDDYGIELLEYIGDSPLYYIIGHPQSGDNSREVSNVTFDGNKECMVKIVDWDDTAQEAIFKKWDSGWKISELDSEQITEVARAAGAINPPTYSFERLIEQLDPVGNVTETSSYYRTRIAFDDDYETDDEGNIIYNEYTVAKITKDNGLNVCGYRICDIIYPYDLIAAPGDSVTSVLDKLVKMLGNFEYYFDVDGKFIFQKKRTYLDISYNNIINEHSINSEVWADSSEHSSKYSYNFDRSELISSISNSPNISNLKNDFSLWGTRQNGNVSVPIHMRYAIEHKPYGYRTFDEKVPIVDEATGEYKRDPDTDEILYETVKGAWYWSKEGLAYRDRMINDLNNDLKDDADIINTFLIADYTKTKNTNGLPETWWEVQDWAKYYGIINALIHKKDPSELNMAKLEAYYPPKYLMYYKSYKKVSNPIAGEYYYHQGEKNGLGEYTDWVYARYPDDIDADDCYEPELSSYKEVESYGIQPQGGHNTGSDWPIQMIIQYADGTYESHGESCTHAYTWFLSLPDGAHAYIYKPSFPGEMQYHYEQDEENDIIIDLSAYSGGVSSYEVDWREIIFRMANDYRKHYHDPDFLLKLRDNNKYLYNTKTEKLFESLYPTGYTGYEKFYIDFEMNISQGVVAYWRELYNPDAKGKRGRYLSNGTFLADSDITDGYDPDKSYQRGDLIMVEEEGSNTIYKSLTNDNKGNIPNAKSAYWLESEGTFVYDKNGWNPTVLDNPEMLNFWFDFLDTQGEFNRYSIHNIGARPKATNDDKIKAIYFREVPNVIFDMPNESEQYERDENWVKPGYCYMKMPKGINDYFTISSRGKNMMDVLEEWLYNYTYPASSITLTSIPIYYLTPNTLIYVDDVETGITGEYIMQKFSLQLGLSASMTINAVETAKRLY